MSALNPIVRSDRQQSLIATEGQAVFGPLAFRLWDVLDIAVAWRAPGADAFTPLSAGFAVALDGDAPAFPTVTFDEGWPAGTTLRFRGARIPERTSDVTLAGSIRSALLERDLDIVNTVEQELRRDVDGLALAAGEVVIENALAAQRARDQAEAFAAALSGGIGARGAFIGDGVEDTFDLGQVVGDPSRLLWFENGILQFPGVHLETGGQSVVRAEPPADGAEIYWFLIGAPSGNDSYQLAAANVSGHRVVASVAGGVVHADRTDLAHAPAILGVTIGAAAETDPVTVRTAGTIFEPTWTFTPHLPIWLGDTGHLTQTPPAKPGASYSIPIGFAIAATAMLVRIGEPIILA